LLLEIYEELMFELPAALEEYQNERDKNEDDEDRDNDCSSPLKSILLPSSLGAVSETSSVSSQQRF